MKIRLSLGAKLCQSALWAFVVFIYPEQHRIHEREGMAGHQSCAFGIKLLSPLVLAKEGPANVDFTAIGVEEPYREESISRPVALSAKPNPLPLLSALSKTPRFLAPDIDSVRGVVPRRLDRRSINTAQKILWSDRS